MKADVLFFTAGAAATVLGVVLFVAPAPSPGPSSPPVSVDERAAATRDEQAAARLTALFDLSRLPERASTPAAREVHADPAAALRRYVFVGGAESGVRGRALFEREGAVTALAPGEDLEGFILVRFDAAAAEFERDGMAVSLPIRN
ncbi:MAG: hypothetical protein RIC52_07055 [Amphiplicatus sp.]